MSSRRSRSPGDGSPSRPPPKKLDSKESGVSKGAVASLAPVKRDLSDEVNAHYKANMPQMPGIGHHDMLAALSNGSEPYVFSKRLGKGAYASVYKAVKKQGMNTDQQQEVAIKVIKPRNPNQFAANANETRVLNMLLESPHPNIIRTLELFEHTDRNKIKTFYMVFELAPLGDLYSALCQLNGQGEKIWVALEPQYCRHLIQGIARGVQHLFSLGISHADIKLENIVMFGDVPDPNQAQDKSRFMRMVPKLIDFNISEIEKQPGEQIMLNHPRGTLYTAAPESRVIDTPYDIKIADVYSVGAVLLSMLLGAQPWKPPANCPTRHIDDESIKMKNDRNFLEQLVQPFEARLKQVLLRLLEPLPQNRITIQEFLSDNWFTQTTESQESEEG